MRRLFEGYPGIFPAIFWLRRSETNCAKIDSWIQTSKGTSTNIKPRNIATFPALCMAGQASIFSISPPPRIDICVHNESKINKMFNWLICIKNNDN